MSILVVAERAGGGQFHPMSGEALAAGRTLSELLGVPLSCVALNESVYTADAFSSQLKLLIDEISPTYVVFAHTYQVRDYAPKLATALGGTFLSDCISLRVDNDEAVFSRQIFQGKLIADYSFSGGGPHLLSVQSGAFAATDITDVEVRAIGGEGSASRVTPSEPYREATGTTDLSSAERIVSVGRGIKDPENIALAQKLADALGADLGASRPICDNGWLPLDRQVGSSGQTVTPKLYLALGISGAIQHQVGMKGSDTIVAINTDESAPIFEIADYGIVGDLFDVVPELIKQLAD